MTLQETLKNGEQYLRDCGIEEAGIDAWLLLSFVTGMDRTRFLLNREEETGEREARRYLELLKRRGSRIPLQHLTGEQEFMGLSFHVNGSVLIPRQDTEILVEEALKRLKPGMRALDLCTGSGCIAVSLAKLREKTERDRPEAASIRNAQGRQPLVDAADISPEALAVAAENIRQHRADVRLVLSDLFAGIPEAYDMIVSNPPYIPTAVIGELPEEVRFHEPHLALDGREDGLFFYREILRQGHEHLSAGGWILFEIGCDQGEAVSRLMEENGYAEIRIVKDLSALDRVALGRALR